MSGLRRRWAVWLGVILALATLLGSHPMGSQALFTDTAAVGGNTFTSGTWRTYWLHNNPTPPVGNTNRQADLPMNNSSPTAATLYNYDANADAFPGRLIDKGGIGAGETDIVKYQNWRTAVLTSSLNINGAVTVPFWSAMKDFGPAKAGSVTIYLRNFNPGSGTYTEIANTTVTAADWQNGSGTWVSRTATINVANHTLAIGRRLEVKIIVGSAAADNMWFAYDTTAYPTRVALP